MAPPGILVDITQRDNLRLNEASDSEDDTPVVKVKIPLNKQYQALEERLQQSALKSADIDWVPSRDKYLQRVQRRLKEGISSAPLPAGFPACTTEPSCWTADQVQVSELIRTFSNPEIVEIEGALAHFKG